MEENNIKEKENLEVEEEAAEDAKPYQVAIEDARHNLFTSYSKTRRISNIIMFAVVIAIVGIMFLIIQNNNVLKIVGYSLAGALILGMILYYVLTRKKFPNKTKEYMEFVSSTLRNRMFKDNYSELNSDDAEKFELADFMSDGVYKEATGINSRNIVRGAYKGHHFTYGEVALLRPSTRKQPVPPLFVGRYISLPNDQKFDGRLLIVYKNDKNPYDLPNDIDDLRVLEEKDDVVIYGVEGADYKKIIGTEFLSKLRKVKLEKHLLNINIVFWGGHTAAYLSYDDTIMSFPFDKPFDYDGFEQSYNDFDAVIALIAGE